MRCSLGPSSSSPRRASRCRLSISQESRSAFPRIVAATLSSATSVGAHRVVGQRRGGEEERADRVAKLVARHLVERPDPLVAVVDGGRVLADERVDRRAHQRANDAREAAERPRSTRPRSAEDRGATFPRSRRLRGSRRGLRTRAAADEPTPAARGGEDPARAPWPGRPCWRRFLPRPARTGRRRSPRSAAECDRGADRRGRRRSGSTVSSWRSRPSHCSASVTRSSATRRDTIAA